jgi:hypothetical protein
MDLGSQHFQSALWVRFEAAFMVARDDDLRTVRLAEEPTTKPLELVETPETQPISGVYENLALRECPEFLVVEVGVCDGHDAQ